MTENTPTWERSTRSRAPRQEVGVHGPPSLHRDLPALFKEECVAEGAIFPQASRCHHRTLRCC